MRKSALYLVFAAMSSATLLATAEVHRPVSEPANPMFLKGITNRPWWNDAWEFRLPISVSESSTNKVAAYIADFILDLGRADMADSVRIVTDYDEEIPCWAQAAGGKDSTKVRIQFKTPLGAAENRSFLVYFGNPKAKRVELSSEVSADINERFITLRNAMLTLDFARHSPDPDVLRRFKVNASPTENELTQSATRISDYSLRIDTANAPRFYTNRVELTLSTPFMKEVRVANGVFSSTYTLYADSPRLDYAFKQEDDAKSRMRRLSLALSPGGGSAWDDLVYPSLAGSINTDRAQLDYRPDSGEPIRHSDLGDWSGEGWYATTDRKTGVSVGQFYSAADILGLGQSEWNGDTGARCHYIQMTLRGDGKQQGEVRGALFGTLARADIVRAEYRSWANPPRILAGRAEPRRAIVVKPPDMARDFCSFQQIGVNLNALHGDVPGAVEEAAENTTRYLRRDGFNGVHFVNHPVYFWNWNPDKTLFDEIHAAWTNKTYGGSGKARAEWSDSERGSRTFRSYLNTLHRDGIGAFHWGGLLFGNAILENDRARGLEVEALGTLNAEFGFDATWCAAQGREGPTMPDEDWSRLGGYFWKYKNRADRERFLALQDIRIEHARKFCEAVRKAGGKPLTWGCDLGLLGNEQFSLDNAGDFDVVIQELMIGHLLDRNERNRFGITRMRAMVNNEPRTVWNHFWTRIAGDDVRIGNCDLPFMYGVNGFNQEGDDYRHVDDEIVTKGSDFYHFAYNTGLSEISPKFTPVKYITVFRDSGDHRADILEGRCGTYMYVHRWDDTTETDGAANIWASAPSIHVDLTLNRFFTLENLKRYPILALPHNYMLTEERFAIVRRYVEDGGVCYAEGAKFPYAKFFTDGSEQVPESKLGLRRRSFGKGKLLYAPGNPSLKGYALDPGSELRRLIVAESGVPEPVVIEERFARKVDGFVRTDGANWMFGSFALAMPGGTADVVRATFNLPAAKGRTLFALDMKSGKRVPFDRTLEYLQRPGEVCNYLIGDDAFTAVPEHAFCETGSFGATRRESLTDGATRNLAAMSELGDFKAPVKVVLFQKTAGGFPNATHARGSLMQELMTGNSYNVKSFRDALADAKLLQLRALDAETLEKVFFESVDELKAFLRRGGTIMFDRTRTTPTAKAFLKDVGVYDVNESIAAGGGYHGEANFDDLGKTHELFTKPWNIYQPWVGKRMQSGVCYTKWDAENQFAPFVICKRDRPDKESAAAMCVCQDKVLGAGRIVFQENDGAFTSWYEGVTYGENLLSWAIGINFKEHKRKVQLLYGGFGAPIKLPETKRNSF